jgi:hypothetical protein
VIRKRSFQVPTKAESKPHNERKARKGETLAGLAVVRWTDTPTTAYWCNRDARTLYAYRGVGLPAKRDTAGQWWYAWPHTAIWSCSLIYKQQGDDRAPVTSLPFSVALAAHRLRQAEEEARLEAEATAVQPMRRGRYSYRTEEEG